MRLISGPRVWLSGASILGVLALVLGSACSKPAAPQEEARESGTSDVALFTDKGLGLLPPEDAKAPAPTDGRSWPMLGGTPQRNMVNTVEKDVPADWSVQKGKEKNVKWSAALGSLAYGGPVVAAGKIFVGTNNGKPRDLKVTGDKGVLMCFRESDGKFLWQAVHDKLPNPEENDCRNQGICSAPVVEGNRLYYVSNRCELVCADVEGDQATGQAKILWALDMIKELEVYPCYLAVCSPLIVGDLVFAVTGNGTVPNERTLPAPKAPSFVAVNKNTGKVEWQDASPGERIMDGQWSNPAAAEVNGKVQVIFPGGDGWLYAFEAKTGKLVWKFDCNPKAATAYKPGGGGERCFFIATPVVHDNRLYVGVSQEPDSGGGPGHLWCIDVTKEPANKEKDLSPVNDNFDPKAAVNKNSGLVWHYGGPVLPRPEDNSRDIVFGRTLSTVAVHGGLVYVAELEGFLHCLDAKTGKKHWEFDLKDGTWNSPFYVDGKVYLGTDPGDLFIFPHGKELKTPAKIDMRQPLKTPPVAVNGVLYIVSGSTLYAIAAK